MKPYRTDEYVHKLFYETSRFSAFNHQWVVKARINNSQRDPHTVNDRQITYQVGLICQFSLMIYLHVFFRFFHFFFFTVNIEDKDQFATVDSFLCAERSILRHESEDTHIQTRFHRSRKRERILLVAITGQFGVQSIIGKQGY